MGLFLPGQTAQPGITTYTTEPPVLQVLPVGFKQLCELVVF